jgi:hypothetical protein
MTNGNDDDNSNGDDDQYGDRQEATIIMRDAQYC